MGKLFGQANPNYAQPEQLKFRNTRQPKALPTATSLHSLLQVQKSWQQKLKHVQTFPMPPATPLNFAVAASEGGIRLTWGEVPNADGYIIYRATTPDFSSMTQIRIGHGDIATFFDPLIGAQNVYYKLVATAGTLSNPHSVLSAPTAVISAHSLVASFGAGKNMCPNPGFEQNDGVQTPLMPLVTPNAPVCNAWYIGQIDPNSWQVQYENNGNGRNGSNNLLLRLPNNTSIPSDNSFKPVRVFTAGRIPIAPGDYVRVGAYNSWAQTASLPAGTSGIMRIGFFLYAADGTQLGELSKDVTSPSAFTWREVTYQIPNTLSGQPPAYLVVQCSGFILNNSGSTFNTGGNLYMDLRFDDLKVVIQNTAFDVTPINTAYVNTSAGSLLSQSGTTSTIHVAGFTMQYGDGLVSYNSGTTSAPSNTSTGYVYTSDPTYSGGAVAYLFTQNYSTIFNSNGNLVIGKITLASGGGGSGGTGGGGTAYACFAPWVKLKDGRPIEQVRRGDFVETYRGRRRVLSVIRAHYSGPMCDMGNGELVTPAHHFVEFANGTPELRHAHELWEPTSEYSGEVISLEVESDLESERNFYLANGKLSHNFLPNGS